MSNHLAHELSHASYVDHEMNDHYVRRLPTPPRPTFISPCAMGVENQTGPITISPSLPFLRNIDWKHYIYEQPPLGEWKYEARREAQAVLPFLYLGPNLVCKDAAFLRDARITAVLSVRHANAQDAKPLQPAVRKAQELGLVVQTLDVMSSQELIGAFRRATEMINNRLLGESTAAPPSAILVCDDSGNSRAAAVVVAYCMDVLGLSLSTALQFVHFKRFCTSLDDSLKYILASYADILQAKRDVAASAPVDSRSLLNIPNIILAPTAKRQRELDDDIDDDMMDPDDMDQRGIRSFTPFAD